jgi:hypothetical protein
MSCNALTLRRAETEVPEEKGATERTERIRTTEPQITEHRITELPIMEQVIPKDVKFISVNTTFT